jgi:hypothetical protein
MSDSFRAHQAKEKFNKAIRSIAAEYVNDPFAVFYDVDVRDSRITSWRDWTPVTHTERALKFGPVYVLVDGARIGIPIGKSEMVKAYDLEQFEAFVLSMSWGRTRFTKFYETFLDELDDEFDLSANRA